MIGAPLLGAVHVTSASLEAGLAVTLVGAEGGVMAKGVTAADGEDADPVPAELVALTVKV